MDECVFPFGLIEINETRARYSVTAGETPLERLAARFISTLTTHDELAGGLHRLVSLVPENLLYYKGKSGVDAVILTLTRGLPIPPQPKGGRRRKEPEIETW
jgi:hypothetical protein